MDALLPALTFASLAAAAGFGFLSWRLLRDERRRSSARVAALAAAIDDAGPAAPAPAVGELFAPGRSAAAPATPIIRIAAGVMMALILIVAAAAGRGERSGAGAGAAPLELLSMRHARDGDTLTVSGLVRNPPAADRITRITAVVVAFDRVGTFVATARAPLDFTTLGPGDESPFVVTLPKADGVGRYRVSFRSDDGLVRHVDRRVAPPVAARLQ